MRRGFVLFASVLAVAACSPIANDDSGADGDGSSGSCMSGESQCNGNVFETCENGVFTPQETCTSVCLPDLGCVECRPDFGNACVGDAVYSCNADGTLGGLLETCPVGTCSNGSCVQPACGAGAELVYVIDQDYRLLSFDPIKLDLGQEPFTLIGQVTCPTSAPSYPSFSSPPAPFSMSVDRDAVAWVLFTNGEIFHVSTEDASCQATGFTRGQQGFELFGMGFVSDAPGSAEETLWIAGGAANTSGNEIGDLGYIDKQTMQVTGIGELPQNATYSPEFTGTGDAELFGFYPGDHVALVNKQNASHQQIWNLPSLGTVIAWAFAHWGGNFYIFMTESGFLNDDSQVQYLNRQTGEVSTLLNDLPYVIVGAGVSTCAPVVID